MLLIIGPVSERPPLRGVSTDADEATEAANGIDGILGVRHSPHGESPTFAIYPLHRSGSSVSRARPPLDRKFLYEPGAAGARHMDIRRAVLRASSREMSELAPQLV